MNTIEKAFSKIGARVAIDTRNLRSWERLRSPIPASFNVLNDKDGEYFHIEMVRMPKKDIEIEVLNVAPKDKHLLMLLKVEKDKVTNQKNRFDKYRFLMGHDERHWFVAAIPETSPATTVAAAKEALKPTEVKTRETGLRSKARNSRKNRVRLRQGEWFFIPAPDAEAFIDPKLILKNEPMRRSGRNKPHFCQELYRFGGETVYVDGDTVLTVDQYERLSSDERQGHNFKIMKRNPKAWVRGTVKHSDHATIKLNGWHEVVSNTELQAVAMQNVTFLD